MDHRAVSLPVALIVGLQPVPARELVEVTHQPVSCVVADKFPRLEARILPADRVGAARVFFQGATSDWYSVSMKKEGDGFAAVLPKPKKDLKAVRYYIEVIGQGAQSTRTPESTAAVVRSASECKGVLGAAIASASVIVQGPAGVAALPAGFASSGVIAGNASASGAASGTAAAGSGAAAGAAGAAGAGAAAGGGIGATALVVGGLAAGGAVAVGVAAKGGDSGGSDSSSNSNPPSNLILLSVTIVTASGSSGSISTPNIDVSACRANTTFGGGPITVRADGSFDETWNLNTPALRVAGRADASGLQATLTCLSGSGPTGSLSATGSGYSLSGTFSFGSSQFGSQGTISVRRTQ
jgi:hypothetical protein